MFFKAEISILIINKKTGARATGFRSNLTKLTIKLPLTLICILTYSLRFYVF